MSDPDIAAAFADIEAARRGGVQARAEDVEIR
jgi:hypothetical protein